MTRTPVALVTGASGQDGSYLVERLLADGYAVHGLVPPAGAAGTVPGVADLPAEVTAHAADLTDPVGVRALVRDVSPDEVYNLGGLSSVARSWQEPELTARVNGLAVVSLLEAAAETQESTGREVRLVQASSAEIFGEAPIAPQDERTPVRPVSPYGAAKAFAHHCVGVARRRELFAVSCILYNHESPRRPTTFVTRKITSGAARIAREGGTLALGNLDARRDWGWAPDYVDAMVRAARHTEPLDYVVATGEAHSVADFVAAAFSRVGIDDWQAHVRIDPEFVRPADPAVLIGDATRARTELGWSPSVTFDELVGRMVDADVATLERAG
ncbi:GDPmannose 4,6-dehydratase [Knoellia remsis]|uniref:GDP-mannose 4,6-dehydratase n=1 Tax=Knoellia remsis TaxID=407159 RepID=A0A2T0UZ61_9MICO|nr:GDP-mannose 4,6-dehydratase [Knoellia remsis]PRY63209.1 GDPmannose 4,6-dehydratase [Knoellia remsis]